MKLKIIFTAVLFSQTTIAALQSPSPYKVEKKTDAVLMALELPSANRQTLLQQKGMSAYPQLVEIAFSKKYNMRMKWRALIAAAQLGKEKSIADLKKAISHPDWYMRNAGLVAIQRVNFQEGVKAARKLIKDIALVVRAEAVTVLSQSMAMRDRKLLWRELKNKNNFRKGKSLWIRRRIVENLAERPLSHEISRFVRILSERDEKIQATAVAALEKLTRMRLGQAEEPLEHKQAYWKEWWKKRR